jgi:hypothetical protein
VSPKLSAAADCARGRPPRPFLCASFATGYAALERWGAGCSTGWIPWRRRGPCRGTDFLWRPNSSSSSTDFLCRPNSSSSRTDFLCRPNSSSSSTDFLCRPNSSSSSTDFLFRPNSSSSRTDFLCRPNSSSSSTDFLFRPNSSSSRTDFLCRPNSSSSSTDFLCRPNSSSSRTAPIDKRILRLRTPDPTCPRRRSPLRKTRTKRALGVSPARSLPRRKASATREPPSTKAPQEAVEARI